MIFLDENTPREVLEDAAVVEAGFDPIWVDASTDAQILAGLRQWIEEGNEA